jgi:hypothetical protein
MVQSDPPVLWRLDELSGRLTTPAERRRGVGPL